MLLGLVREAMEFCPGNAELQSVVGTMAVLVMKRRE